jgi:hypothetical protein
MPPPPQVWDGQPPVRAQLIEWFNDGTLAAGQVHAAHLAALAKLAPDAAEGLLQVGGGCWQGPSGGG